MNRHYPFAVMLTLGIGALGCSIVSPLTSSERTPEATQTSTSRPPAQTPTPVVTATRILLPTSESRPSGNAGIAEVTKVDKVQWYSVPYDGLAFVGLLENTGSRDLKRVEVAVVLNDGSGRAVAAALGYTELALIRPGETSPFRISFVDLPPAWQDYEIVIQGGAAEYLEKCRDFEVLSQTLDRPDSETYAIRGEVENTGKETCKYILVAAAFYDAAGNLVGVDSGYTTREKVKPGETSRYEILYYISGLGEVDHFELWVEGMPEK